MVSWMKSMNTWRLVFRAVEWGVLVFPLSVLGLTSVSFWFGGSCAPWHFWSSVGVALGAMALLRSLAWRVRLLGMGVFLGFLAFLWVVTGCLVTNGIDSAGYHFPVTRLLTMGWNPVWTSTQEALVASTGLDPSGMWTPHVLFMARPIETFNAVFAFFTQTPFDLTFPIIAFLLLPACASLWRLGRSLAWSPLTRLASLLVVLALLFERAFGIECCVDIVVGLSGMALLSAMIRTLKGECGLRELFIFSLWMMVSKQSSLLTCFVFWVAFSGLLLWRFRSEWKVWSGRQTFLGVLLVVAFCTICTSPYLTSWKTTGHPLYPAYTVDPERFPALDITPDFRRRNADAEAMGHVGHFLNAYMSPSLMQAYYGWKTGRSDFLPYCEVWQQEAPRTGGYVAPTSLGFRLAFLLSLALLFGFGSRSVKVLTGLLLLGAFCFPTIYLGYVRYLPWFYLLFGLSLGTLLQLVRRWCPRLAGLGSLGISGGSLAVLAFLFCIHIDRAWELHQAFRSESLIALVSDEQRFRNNLVLLTRQHPALEGLPVLDPEAMTREDLHRFDLPYFNGVLKPGAERPVSRFAEAKQSPTKLGRYQRYLTFVPVTLWVTLPKVLWARLGEL